MSAIVRETVVEKTDRNRRERVTEYLLGRMVSVMKVERHISAEKATSVFELLATSRLNWAIKQAVPNWHSVCFCSAI